MGDDSRQEYGQTRYNGKHIDVQITNTQTVSEVVGIIIFQGQVAATTFIPVFENKLKIEAFSGYLYLLKIGLSQSL